MDKNGYKKKTGKVDDIRFNRLIFWQYDQPTSKYANEIKCGVSSFFRLTRHLINV